jgi:acyl-CoA thioesterase
MGSDERGEPVAQAGPAGDDAFAADRAADRDFLGLELTDEGLGSFTLTRSLARHDGRLYGGTAVAAAITMAEEATGRPSLWTTVQFTSGAVVVGDRIDVAVEVLAAGRRTSQVRVIARVGDQEVFGALGATALPKDGGLQGTFEQAPPVPAPEDCERFEFPLPEWMRETRIDVQRHMDIRMAGRDKASGQIRFWARARGQRATPAIVGYLADMVPMAVVQATGHMGGGTSLDNTLRMGARDDTEWVLLQLDPHLAMGGYGTGTALVWSPAGVLMGVASQTASLIALD